MGAPTAAAPRLSLEGGNGRGRVGGPAQERAAVAQESRPKREGGRGGERG